MATTKGTTKRAAKGTTKRKGSTRKGSKDSGPNLFDVVTERIIAELESGNVPWRRPWSVATMPRSLSSGKPYRGVNVFLLLSENRSSPFWATFNQIRERGGNVRKGEKSTLVVFWRRIKVTDEETGKDKVIPILKYFRVFNLDQTDGVALTEREEKMITHVPLSDEDSCAAAEEIIKGYGVRTRHDGGARAYYSPAGDGMIHLPKRETFKTSAGYYSVRFHEMTHSTGHPARLDRHTADDQFVFGSHAYGREELVAQMGAAFLAGEAGILPDTIENDAAYLRSWIATIKEDTRAVVVAAGAAQRAVDHIMGRTYEKDATGDDSGSEGSGETVAQAA